MCLITAMKEMHNTHVVFYPGALPPSILNNIAAQLTEVYPGFKNERVCVSARVDARMLQYMYEG